MLVSHAQTCKCSWLKVHRVPTLRGFWELKKTALRKNWRYWDCRGTAWWPPEDHLTILWQPPDNCKMIFMKSTYLCLKDNRQKWQKLRTCEAAAACSIKMAITQQLGSVHWPNRMMALARAYFYCVLGLLKMHEVPKW